MDIDMRTKPTLVGERVILRPVSADDADGLLDLVADEEGNRLTGTRGLDLSPEAARNWYGSRAEHDDRLDLAVVDRATGEYAGEVVLNELDRNNRSCNFRIGLRPSFQDRGLGSEATRLILEHAFAIGLHRVGLEVYAFNPRARRVYERAGFVCEGTRRDALWWNGEWTDAIVMSVLETDPCPAICGRRIVPGMPGSPIRLAYDMWPQYNSRLRDVIGAMSPDQLAVRPSVTGWPVWAIVGHTAAARVYWLCEIAGEPGIETTPFTDAANGGWEDDLDHPRGADELVEALDSTYAIVDACLDRWTTDMLADPIQRESSGATQTHSRGSILQRLLTHEAYHCGELSQTLGIHGLPQIDLWRPD